MRRQIEIAVESADRQTIKEYMGNAAVFVIASSADFKPAEKLLAFAAQRPRDSRLSTISWRSWPPCDYGESTNTKHPVGFVTGITKPLTQHNPVLRKCCITEQLIDLGQDVVSNWLCDTKQSAKDQLFVGLCRKLI